MPAKKASIKKQEIYFSFLLQTHESAKKNEL